MIIHKHTVILSTWDWLIYSFFLFFWHKLQFCLHGLQVYLTFVVFLCTCEYLLYLPKHLLAGIVSTHVDFTNNYLNHIFP